MILPMIPEKFSGNLALITKLTGNIFKVLKESIQKNPVLGGVGRELTMDAVEHQKQHCQYKMYFNSGHSDGSGSAGSSIQSVTREKFGVDSMENRQKRDSFLFFEVTREREGTQM